MKAELDEFYCSASDDSLSGFVREEDNTSEVLISHWTFADTFEKLG